jgi:cytochrome b involved in lipid metabolism
MRKLFIISTILFWLALIFFWISSARDPVPKNIAEPAIQDTPAITPAHKGYTLTEVALHYREIDCWMAIEGQVYDVTSYLPSHPSDPALFLPWCGKEASLAWQTKTVGRPHTRFAASILKKYVSGPLLTPQ